MDQLLIWLKEIVKSKRFQLFIVGLIVTLGNKYFGINLDETQVASFVALIFGLIIADSQKTIGVSFDEAKVMAQDRRLSQYR